MKHKEMEVVEVYDPQDEMNKKEVSSSIPKELRDAICDSLLKLESVDILSPGLISSTNKVAYLLFSKISGKFEKKYKITIEAI